MTIRFPLLFAFAVLFASGCVDLDALKKSYAERDVIEKVGVLAHLDIAWSDSTAALKRALAFYRAEGVAQVIIVGDPTANGYANQREVFEAAWHEAFRGTKEPKLVLGEDPCAYAGIRFTGQGYLPLTDLLCVQPLTGKTINAGSMHGIKVSGIFVKGDPKMIASWKNSAQGLFVLRRDSGLTVKRLDFSSRVPEEVGPPWEVDAEGKITAEGQKPPEFWPDTVLSVVRGYSPSGSPIYTLRWPPVLAMYTGERAFSYDIVVEDEVLCRIQSKGFHQSETRDTAAVTCIVHEEALKGRSPRFGVTPVSSLGLSGKTIWSTLH